MMKKKIKTCLSSHFEARENLIENSHERPFLYVFARQRREYPIRWDLKVVQQTDIYITEKLQYVNCKA